MTCSKTVLLPMFPYVGGKRLEINVVRKYMPTSFENYCEPFFGGGAVYFMLGINKPSHINDTNKNVTAFYKGIQKGKGASYLQFLKTTKRDKKTFNRVKKNDSTSGRRFIYLMMNTYRAVWLTNKKGKFSGYFDKRVKKNGTIPQALSNNNYQKQLQNATITCTDFEEVMNKNNDPDTFMFLDPPYHKTMRYCSDFTVQDHKRLATAFKRNKSKCLMIINSTVLTRHLYRGYIVEEYLKKYNVNNGKKSRYHIVVKNY